MGIFDPDEVSSKGDGIGGGIWWQEYIIWKDPETRDLIQHFSLAKCTVQGQVPVSEGGWQRTGRCVFHLAFLVPLESQNSPTGGGECSSRVLETC